MISGFPGALGSSIKVYVKKYARTRVCVMIEREREIEIEKNWIKSGCKNQEQRKDLCTLEVQ